jgi:small-conductance mechanosensitive channel
MKSAALRLTRPFQISLACLAGGIVSLLSSPENHSLWDFDKFWLTSIFSHCVLIGITFLIFHEQKLSLNTRAGHFNTFTLALISSLTALLLVALGFYVPFALIISGRAFLTAFVATYLYALLRTID